MVTSALEHYDAARLIGVLMTGMGHDGADAMTRLRKQGGRTIAEAESTAVVWGMPGELVKNGGAEIVRPLEDIAAAIIEWWSPCPSLSATRQPRRRRPTSRPTTVPSHLAALRSPDAEARWSAARALGRPRRGGRRRSRAALAAETVPRVREAIMTALMRVGDEASVAGAAALPAFPGCGPARGGDRSPAGAAGRDRALHGGAAWPTPIPTCASWRPSSPATCRRRNATRCCASLLEREQHPNVCAAAIDVLAEVGTRDAVPVLRSCAERFAGTAVPAVRGRDRDRADFRHGRLGRDGAPGSARTAPST